jgi:hypothetical protein
MIKKYQSYVTLLLFLHLSGAYSSYLNVVPKRGVIEGSKTPFSPDWLQLPFDSNVRQNENNIVITEKGTLYTKGMHSTSEQYRVLEVTGDLKVVPSNARYVSDYGSNEWIVTPTFVYVLNCDFSSNKCMTKKLKSSNNNESNKDAMTEDAVINDALYYDNTLFTATNNGLYIIPLSTSSTNTLLMENVTINVIALSTNAIKNKRAWNMPNIVIAGGTKDKLLFFDPIRKVLLRWEWTTNTFTEQGGLVDDTITSLHFASFHDDDGALLIGNPTCFNVMYTNGSFIRIDGDGGMPYGNITDITTTGTTIWFGTTHGIVMYDGSNTNSNDTPWHYFNGPRWLSGSSHVITVTSIHNGITVSTDGGVTDLMLVEATLLEKALRFQAIAEKRHNRHGMISECTVQTLFLVVFLFLFSSCAFHMLFVFSHALCSLVSGDMPSYGNITTCLNKDNDNNGLWTSIMVVAMYMKYNVTGNINDADAATAWFNGKSFFFFFSLSLSLCVSPSLFLFFFLFFFLNVDSLFSSDVIFKVLYY